MSLEFLSIAGQIKASRLIDVQRNEAVLYLEGHFKFIVDSSGRAAHEFSEQGDTTKQIAGTVRLDDAFAKSRYINGPAEHARRNPAVLQIKTKRSAADRQVTLIRIDHTQRDFKSWLHAFGGQQPQIG